MGPNWHPLMRVCDKKASSARFFVSGCVFFIIFAAGKTRFCLLHLITTTMRIIKFLSVWIVWMMALPSGAQTILHRVSANVSLHPDYVVVTEVRDITPGGCDEAFVPIEDKHMTKKFIMNVSLGEDYFQRLEWWKSSAPSAEKQKKCGRKWVDDHLAHYCWGVNPDKRLVYYASYPLANMLYNDGKNDVLEYDFVNLSGQTPAEKAEVIISLSDGTLKPEDIDFDHSSSDLNITFDGDVVVIRPKTSQRVSNLPIRLAFRPGLFEGIPSQQKNGNGGQTENASSFVHVDPSGGIPAQAFEIPASELHSAMMNESKHTTESGGLPLFEYFYAYPKTSLALGCVLVILLGVGYRLFRIFCLKRKKS